MAEEAVLQGTEEVASADFEGALKDLEGFAKEPYDQKSHPSLAMLVERLASLGKQPEFYR